MIMQAKVIASLGSDQFIADTAKVSHGGDKCENVEKLLEFLYVNKHLTPFEFGVLVFDIKAPLFVVAQIERYRHATYLEQSFRYCKSDLEFYKPATVNEQLYNAILHECTENYKTALKYGWKYEDARIWLPQNVMKKLRMQICLRNLLHLFDERLSKTAQQATRELAGMMYEETKKLFPITINIYEKYK